MSKITKQIIKESHDVTENVTVISDAPMVAPSSHAISTKPEGGQLKALEVSEQLSDTSPTLGSETKSESFLDSIYDEINNAIGGESPNQMLCLTLPGQALSAEDFAYEYDKNAPKGPTIEANESRLANKLFDACRIVAADNGMTLPYQYKSALDMLTPKLNSRVAKAKNQLRELLLTPYPYDFGDKNDKTLSLQEVFYRLYDDYVKAEKEWAEKQNKKRMSFVKDIRMTPQVIKGITMSICNGMKLWHEVR